MEWAFTFSIRNSSAFFTKSRHNLHLWLLIIIEKSLNSNRQNKGKTFQDFCRMCLKRSLAGLDSKCDFIPFLQEHVEDRSCFVFNKMFFFVYWVHKAWRRPTYIHTYIVWKVCLLVNHFWEFTKIVLTFTSKIFGQDLS